jgi:hypothetical protein
MLCKIKSGKYKSIFLGLSHALQVIEYAWKKDREKAREKCKRQHRTCCCSSGKQCHVCVPSMCIFSMKLGTLRRHVHAHKLSYKVKFEYKVNNAVKQVFSTELEQHLLKHIK